MEWLDLGLDIKMQVLLHGSKHVYQSPGIKSSSVSLGIPFDVHDKGPVS